MEHGNQLEKSVKMLARIKTAAVPVQSYCRDENISRNPHVLFSKALFIVHSTSCSCNICMQGKAFRYTISLAISEVLKCTANFGTKPFVQNLAFGKIFIV